MDKSLDDINQVVFKNRCVMADTFEEYRKNGSLKHPDPSPFLQKKTVENLEEQKSSLVNILKLLEQKKKENEKRKKVELAQSKKSAAIAEKIQKNIEINRMRLRMGQELKEISDSDLQPEGQDNFSEGILDTRDGGRQLGQIRY